MYKKKIIEEQESPNNIVDVIKRLHEDIDTIGEDDSEEDSSYKVNEITTDISFIELAIINSFFYNEYLNKNIDDINVSMYGDCDALGRLTIGGVFNDIESFWFSIDFKNISNNPFFIQTKIYLDSRGELVTQLHMTCKKEVEFLTLKDLTSSIKKLAFNNSIYKGKCLKISLKNGRFNGIKIIDVEEKSNDLILSDIQRKYIEHFISRVGKGHTVRYLLNGEPGTGKTESIREISRRLMPYATFIIPEFYSTEDLTSILEACEIFDNAVTIMDDIDLFLGSRENGSYTKILGEFLSFFDGVKKRKISLLASTNDKGLVDKAAERPGRFNFTLDYTFLSKEQIIKVCEIHLPQKWQIKEVYDALNESIDGKKPNITGAFIANLAENIVEMSEDDENWSIKDTISLIKESYRGFYMSQNSAEKLKLGFI